MRVLFVSSGNSINGISSIIKNQGESIREQGVSVVYYTIKGKGFRGYLANVKTLKAYLKANDFDVVHAHYSLSAFVASLAGAKPLVVSLMGSDVKSRRVFRLLIKIFNIFSWSKIIVKSQDMKNSLGIKNVEIIPNGVDFDRFKPMNQSDCKKQLDWDLSKKQILFAANPNRYEKNYKLASDAFELLHDDNIEMKVLEDVPNELMPIYHNAADIVLLTSLWEGSPNVIKEAMACNRPIVATDVGDIAWLFEQGQGCFICSFETSVVVGHLNRALVISKVDLRNRIKKLNLDSNSAAKSIIRIYESL